MSTTGRAEPRAMPRWSVAFASVALGAGLALLHWRMVDNLEGPFQAAWHHSVIVHHAQYPEQYRILTFFMAEGLMRLGWPLVLAYAVLRFACTAASLYAFYYYLRGWFGPLVSLLGFFMFAAVIPFTYMFYGMQVTDPLNMLIFFLAIWAIRDGRDDWLFPLVGIGMFNRETVILLPLLYAIVRWGTPPRRWVPRFVALSILAAAIYIGLRVMFGLAPSHMASGLRLLYRQWRFNLEFWKGWVQVLAFFNLALLFAWRDIRSRPRFLRRSLWFVPLFALINLSVGNLCEIRYFLPILPIVVPLTLMELVARLGPSDPDSIPTT